MKKEVPTRRAPLQVQTTDPELLNQESGMMELECYLNILILIPVLSYNL